MRAVLCTELGPADKLSVGEVASPTAGPGEVVIKVEAAGLNFPDVLIIQGKYQFKPDLPFTPGGEGAGIVTQVGDGVGHLKEGMRVLFMAQVGAFAQQVVTNAMSVMPIPDHLDFDVAAGFTITYGTSYHALKQRAKLQPGETILVLGAAGGVGLATVELAKAMGATVIAAASTDEKLQTAKAHGADHLINYTDTDLREGVKAIVGKGGVDVIYDPVGDTFTEAAFRCMNPGGRHLIIGFAAGDIPQVPVNLCLLKQASLVGVFWGAWATKNPMEHVQNMQEMFAWVADGTMKPLIDSTYGLNEIEKAYAQLTERRAQGKVIIKP